MYQSKPQSNLYSGSKQSCACLEHGHQNIGNGHDLHVFGIQNQNQGLLNSFLL